MEEYDIFLSYSHEDAFIMRHVKEHFEKAGLSVWVDEAGIRIGSFDWSKDIEVALNASKCVVVLTSPEAKMSKWVLEEIAYAEKMSKPVYFALIRGYDLPYGYNRRQFADLRKGNQANLDKLVETIKVDGFTQESSASDIVDDLVEFQRQPLSVKAMRFIIGVLDATVEVMSQDDGSWRAILLWADKSNDALYTIAATDQIPEFQLQRRFKRGQPFAGMAWDAADKEIRIDYPSTIADEDLLQHFNFDDEQVSDFREVDTVLSASFFDFRGRISGILLLDRLLSDGENVPITGYEETVAMSARDRIGPILAGSMPLSYRGYVSLRNILEVTRLIPPLPVPVRAGLFWIDHDSEELYVFVGSDDFESLWLDSDERFKKNVAVVGKVWAEEQLYYESRPADEEKRREYLRTRHNMSPQQIEIAISTRSILGIPIMNRQHENEMIGVLIISSISPMNESELDKEENLVLLGELAKLIERVVERELQEHADNQADSSP